MVSLTHYEQITIPTTKGTLQLKITLSLLNRVSVASLLGALISLLIASLNGAVWAKSIGSAGMFTFGAVGYVCSREGEKFIPATQAKEALDSQLVDEIAAHEFVLRTRGLIQYQSPALPEYSGDLPMDESGWLPPQQMQSESIQTVQTLDPVALKKQNTGLLVCGSSGSAKTTMIRYCLPTWIEEGYQVIVLDPHADPSHPEYPWGDFPYVVGEHEQIFEQVEILLDLLKQKDRQKVICICDEWTDLLGFASLEDKQTKGKQNQTNYFNLLQSFIVRWGTGGRKFNKFLIGIGHTDNVKMWGLDGIGGLLRNYGILRLGDIAVRYGEMQGHNSPLAIYSKQTAYPLLVGEQPTIHPTHGHYPIKENEQPPINLQPLNFHELGFKFVGDLPLNSGRLSQVQSGSIRVHELLEPELLNSLLSKESSNFEPVNLQSLGWDMGGNLPPEYLDSMVQAIRSNMTKKDILEGMFLAKKGGNKYYQSLSNIYEGLRGKV